ncbi:MAG: hypothetical protein AAGM38_10595 [Pseudomonadota bacterium]
MIEASDSAADAAIALEERPTGDFIDGYLAGLATVNAALAGAPANSFFYSFDWIGDGSEPRETSLLSAFQTSADQMSFEISALEDWRPEASQLGVRWLGRDLAPEASQALAREFVDILDAFLAQQTAEVFRIKPLGPDGAPSPLGAAYDHMLFETLDGRLLLEFSMDG